MDRLWFIPKGTTVWERIFFALVLTSIEAFMAISCLLAGIPVLIDPTQYAPLSLKVFDVWVTYPWAMGMLSGGSMTLYGIAISNYRFERIGITILASVSFVYTLALLFALPTSLFAFTSYALFTLAMIARYWVLGQLIHRRNDILQRLRDRM